MASTYEAIATVTVGSGGAANIEFTSIPGTYTDLAILYSGRSEDIYYYGQMYFNNNTTGYTRRALFGDGSTAQSANYSNEYTLLVTPNSYTASTFSNVLVYIPNYASSNNKSFSIDGVLENNASSSYNYFYAGLWSNTAAITSIKMDPEGGNFAQHSTATLYGITKNQEK